MDGAFEVARVVGYLLLMPGLVLRGMFLINRCLWWDAVLNLAGALFYWLLMIPFVPHVQIAQINAPFVWIAILIVFVATALVWLANWIDIAQAARHARSKNMWTANGD